MTNPDFSTALRGALLSEPVVLSRTVAPRRAAVAAIAREHEGHAELLFIQRAEHPLDPWSGQMAFPGGRVDPTDATEQSAAERETREEVGLDLERDGIFLGRLDEIQARARGGVLPLGIAPFVFWLAASVEVGISPEVQQAVWIPLLELYSPRNRKTLDYSMDGQLYTLPSIVSGDKVIWGLTLRILGDLLGRLERGPIGAWAREELGLAPSEPLLPSFDFLARPAATTTEVPPTTSSVLG